MMLFENAVLNSFSMCLLWVYGKKFLLMVLGTEPGAPGTEHKHSATDLYISFPSFIFCIETKLLNSSD